MLISQSTAFGLFSIEDSPMRSETENKYLLKAVEAFKRRLIVVSPEFKISGFSRYPFS